MSGLTERLVAHLGAPSEYVLPVGTDGAPEQAAIHGWRLGEPVVAGPHTFTLCVSVEGEVFEFLHTVVQGAMDHLRWSRWPSLAEAERDLVATTKSAAATGTAGAVGWSTLRDRVAALRALVESSGPTA